MSINTYHKPVDHAAITNMVPPSGQTQALRDALAQEREIARSGDAQAQHMAGLNVAKLETWIARSEANDAARATRERETKAANEASLAARRDADEAALRAQVHANFKAGNPLATDDDFRRLYPQLRDQYLVSRTQNAVAEAARRYRL